MTELERAFELKQQLDLLRPIKKEQEAIIMQKFRLDWNYNSNSLEGNSLTRRSLSTQNEIWIFLTELTMKTQHWLSEMHLLISNYGVHFHCIYRLSCKSFTVQPSFKTVVKCFIIISIATIEVIFKVIVVP